MDNKDGKACAEVLQILQYVPKEDYSKIPKDYLNELAWNAEETDFKYNAAVSFAEQEVSEGAKEILREITEKWWNN